MEHLSCEVCGLSYTVLEHHGMRHVWGVAEWRCARWSETATRYHPLMIVGSRRDRVDRAQVLTLTGTAPDPRPYAPPRQRNGGSAKKL